MRKHTAYNPTEPMIDLMATLCIVLFMVLLVVCAFYIQAQRSAEAALNVLRIQQEAKIFQRLSDDNNELQHKLDAVTQQSQALQRDNQTLQAQMNRINEQQKTLLDDATSIVNNRDALYKELLALLNSKGNIAELKENKIIINIGNDYEPGANSPKDGGQKARVIGAALAGILDRYTQKSSSGVRIAYVEVTGHTDMDMGYTLNDRLGAERAYRWVSYMLEGATAKYKGKGDAVVLRNRYRYGQYIKAASLSMYSPLVGTVTEQTFTQKAHNRRIEITIRFSDDDFDAFIQRYKSTR